MPFIINVNKYVDRAELTSVRGVASLKGQILYENWQNIRGPDVRGTFGVGFPLSNLYLCLDGNRPGLFRGDNLEFSLLSTWRRIISNVVSLSGDILVPGNGPGDGEHDYEYPIPPYYDFQYYLSVAQPFTWDSEEITSMVLVLIESPYINFVMEPNFLSGNNASGWNEALNPPISLDDTSGYWKADFQVPDDSVTGCLLLIGSGALVCCHQRFRTLPPPGRGSASIP